MSEKVVVTGASGHIGYHVARALLARGYETHLLLRSRHVLTDRLEKLGAQAHVVDFADPPSWAAFLNGAAGVFHLAANNTTSQADSGATTDSTLGLTERLVRAALAAGVPKIIYTSSVVVLGRSRDPQRLLAEDDLTTSAESPYVRGKSSAEQFCRAQIAAGADIRILYPSWVVGPDDPRCTPPHKLILDYVAKGQAFAFGGGISITHVLDVAAAHVSAFERGQPGGRYVLGGVNLTFRTFYGSLARLSRRRAPMLMLSKPVMLALASGAKSIFGLLGREASVDPGYVDAIVDNYSWYDSSRAVRELGYRITPVEQTLTEAVLHARQRLIGTYALNAKAAGKRPRRPPNPRTACCLSPAPPAG